MTYELKPQDDFLFMKVGVHAREDLESIIERKKKEISESGLSFWGYGGNTCHPTTKVQPFVSNAVEQGHDVYLCMHEMVSKHFAEPQRASEYSSDGINWNKVPKPINVLGSRYALVLDSLEVADFELRLSETSVGVGLQRGRSGAEYIQGRVDKACLRFAPAPNRASLQPDDRGVRISIAARLAKPYAVLLR